MANIMGKRGIEDAENITKSLSKFSTTLKTLRDQHIEEQFKIGFKEYKQYKQVNAEKLLELEARIKKAQGDQKLIEKLRREQIDLKGVNGYIDAERISHLSDYQQLGFAAAQLQGVKDTFAPKLMDAMQNSDKEYTLNGVKFRTKDIHDNNTDPLEFKRAGIEFHADNIWKNSGLERYSPELLELAGVTEAFDKAKEELNRKYTSRYNIERSSLHRERHEKIFDTIIASKTDPTGDDLELLFRGILSTFDGKENAMTKADTWKVVDSKLINAAMASGEDYKKYLTRILGQEIPESWAKELGVPKGTTFAQHWTKKVNTLSSEAYKLNNERIAAELKTEENYLKDYEIAFERATREGNISEKELREEWVPIWESRGQAIPQVVLDYKTKYDRDADKDRAIIEREIKLNPQNVTERWLEQFHPESKDVEGLRDLVKKNRENIENDIKEKANTLLNEVLEGMNLRENEKSSTHKESLELIQKAAITKYYQNIDQGMDKGTALDQALNGPNGVLMDVEKNRDQSQYVMNPRSDRANKIREENFAKKKLNLEEIFNAKIELQNGPPKMWENEHVGGEYGKTMINEIITNLKDPKYFGKPWLALSRSKTALEYYNGVYRGLNPTANGVYDLIDSQLRLNGYESGFYKSELDMAKENNAWKEEAGSKSIIANPIKELSNLNFIANNDPIAFNDDNDGYSFVWKDVLRTLNFEGVNHFLEGLTQLNDSASGDTGFWDFEDNLSFFTDDEYDFIGEYTFND
tara:strand:- start:4874 stop:7129 length:2256 start_codon:yes stop_codon:yes gene_type:complete